MNPVVYSYLLNIIILILFVVKTIHFIRNKNRNWKFRHWFYFSRYNILQSSNEERARLKRVRNMYSKLIAALVIADLFFLLYLRSSGNL